MVFVWQLWHDDLLQENSPSALGDKPAWPDYKSFKKLFAGNDSQRYSFMPPAWRDNIITSLAENGSIFDNSTQVSNIHNILEYCSVLCT